MTPSLSQRFLLRLSRALHARGVPSHRLEEALEVLCQRLGVSASFFVTPTGIFASFDAPEGPEVHLLRVTMGAPDLGSLADLDAVSSDVARGRLSAAEGLARIEAIESAQRAPGVLATVALYAVTSGAAAVFLGGGGREVAVSLLIGVATGLLSLVGAGSGKGWRVFEAAAAFTASGLATAAAALWPPVSIHVAVLAGLIALLPGYALTVAVAELASGHLASGSARITAAIMSFIMLAFGVALGSQVVELAVGHATSAQAGRLPGWVSMAALPIAAVSFGLLFRAKPRDLPAVLLIVVLGFFGARGGAALLGPELGVFVGSLVVGIGSNAAARLRNRPAVVTLFPGLLLLVPGSLGFNSLASLMSRDVVSGVQGAFTAILMAVALVAGLLLANDIFPSRRAL